MLEGIKILDFSHRLPGPLAGKVLSDLGAEVIKVEDIQHKDPFLSGMFSEFDRSFENWYEELNKDKKILRLDFKHPDIKKEISKLVHDAHGIILSLSPKLKNSLGLNDEDLSMRPLAVIELGASSTHNKAMHDLNALAISGYLSLHVANKNDPVVDPPFMPVAGISFGQQIATQLLASIIKVQKTNQFVKSNSYLHDSTDAIFHPFWSKTLQDQKKTKFLHNGAYPCYSLYRTSDGHYVAVAAVEEKFWTDLIEVFPIDLPMERRFERAAEAFNKVSAVFAKLSSDEIERRSQNKELCISIVRKVN